MEKPEDYIIKAAENKKVAGEMLEGEIKKANTHFDFLAKKAKPEEQEQVLQAIAKAQSILEKIRQGGDIHNLVAQLQKLRI